MASDPESSAAQHEVDSSFRWIRLVSVISALIAVLITIAFFSWWAMKDWWVFGDRPFDQVQWITAQPSDAQRCYRGAMAYDLKTRVLRPGIPREMVTAILGRPTWEDFQQIEYDLGHCLWDTHGLSLQFNAENRLIRARIVQH
ncbi:hypothetical protein [Pseudomethylobacillus aquaticus]|uniref:hypothetical protein n=1 Tax=Pseudomethylobacillus aquaticus TaxID=2676064 RepID=UPI001F032BB1|nr:hypothetical protein [Pseudomethylobacillus aquaticus]